MKRGVFGSKLGLILATAGSAVGLGNVWRFPYLIGENGGGAFLLIYLGCIFLLGIPAVLGEFIVGRHGKSNAAASYRKITGKRYGAFVGALGVITSTIILGFYSVVAGWCLQYLFTAATGHLHGTREMVVEAFNDFSTQPYLPIFWGLVIILLTHFIIVRGVQKGIEQASKIMMPVLLVLLIILVIVSCSLPNSFAGVRFLLMPDFTHVTHGTFLAALGQAFFSLSLGTACLCTYASYFRKDVNLLKSASQIAFLDTVIAVLAGLIIFPAAFSVGVNPDSGPSLVFVTLPCIFQKLFVGFPIIGLLLSVLFYLLLVLAALTSTISMHEIGTAFFHEELHLSRRVAAIIETLLALTICILCSLSVGMNQLQVMGLSLLNACDKLTAQILLPIGAMLTCIIVGWMIPRHIIKDELTNYGNLSSKYVPFLIFAIRYICPLAILIIFLHQIDLV